MNSTTPTRPRSVFEARDLKERTEPFTGWYVPPGFETFDLVQVFDGPIICEGGRIEFGPREYHWGVAHVYDNAGLRIVVRPGNRDRYSAGSYIMLIESMVGEPSQQFSNVSAALIAARDEARAHERRLAVSR